MYLSVSKVGQNCAKMISMYWIFIIIIKNFLKIFFSKRGKKVTGRKLNFLCNLWMNLNLPYLI